SLAGGQYPKGTKVVHSLYGEGTVLHSSGVGNNEKVMIQFHNGMRKRFLAKFAPLSIRS
ncbi:MAG: hypothetical protein HN730_04890, partial [Bdellovibrionales bacterium]|nr:hypothetical protein [Bdellovibrionales bacterium]